MKVENRRTFEEREAIENSPKCNGEDQFSVACEGNLFYTWPEDKNIGK
jgi:hypothetical protein